MTKRQRPIRMSTRTLRPAMLGAFALVLMVAAAACGADATVVAESAASGPALGTAAQPATDAPTADTTQPSAPGEGASTADGAQTSAEANDQLWAGPGWLDLPAGFEITWGYPAGPDDDGIVQGDLRGDLTAAEAVAHVRAVLVANGYTILNDTSEWIVGVDAAGDFVEVGAGSSITSDYPTMHINFSTAASGQARGLRATLDVLLVDLDGTMFEVAGTCSPDGEGFSGADGLTTVGITGEAPDWSIFLTITDPGGAGWSSLGGDITEISATGFHMQTSVVNDSADFVRVTLVAMCS